MEEPFFSFDFEEESDPRENAESLQRVVAEQPSQYSAHSLNRPLESKQGESQNLEEGRRDLDLASRNSKEVDARIKQLMEGEKSLIRRAFPGKTQRLIQKRERLMVANAMEFRTSLLRLSTQFKLEAMRDKYDAVLKAYKAQNRVALIQFFLAKLNELQNSVMKEENIGLRQLEEMYQNAASLPTGSIREKYKERIRDREDRYMNVVDKLLRSFEVILDEQITF